MKPLEFISTVFIVKDAKILLLFNKKLDKWTPPGGHVEQRETPCQTVIRESKEETGFDIEIIGEKPTNSSLHRPASMHLDRLPWDHDHINLIYFAKVKGGKQKKFSDEGWAMRWFSKDDLDAAETYPNIKLLGKRAIDRLKQ